MNMRGRSPDHHSQVHRPPVGSSNYTQGWERSMKRFERARARHYVLPVILVMASLVMSAAAQARSRGRDEASPGTQLLVSGSRYREADIQPGVTVLPPGCTGGCATATADGAYPYVFNNDIVDP